MRFSSFRLYIVLMVIGVFGVIDTVTLLSFHVGTNFGVLFPGIIGVLLIIIGVLHNYFGVDALGLRNRFIRNVLISVFSLWLLTFVAIEELIVTAARSDENKNTDYIVILGAALHGERMSMTLSSRMDTALRYINAHPNIRIVVSGGRGMGESISEAEAMKRFLVANHISENRILKEEKSTSTIENLQNSKNIIENKERRQAPQIMLVTNDFHMFRAKMLAGREGLRTYGIPAQTPISIRFNSYMREYFAIIKSYFLDK